MIKNSLIKFLSKVKILPPAKQVKDFVPKKESSPYDLLMYFRNVYSKPTDKPVTYSDKDFKKLVDKFGMLDTDPKSDPWPLPREGEALSGIYCYLGGDYGTEQEPALIPSRQDHRVVGCTGFGERIHEVGYFILRAGPIHRCPECGQCFALDTAHPGHPDHPDHEYYEEEKDVWDLMR